MVNYIQPGRVVTVPAPYDVASGAGALVGALFGTACFAALSGVDVELNTDGVFDLPKAASQAWTVGAKVYWDNGTKSCTTTVGSNVLIGCAMLAVGSGAQELVGRVRLNGTV